MPKELAIRNTSGLIHIQPQQYHDAVDGLCDLGWPRADELRMACLIVDNGSHVVSGTSADRDAACRFIQPSSLAF